MSEFIKKQKNEYNIYNKVILINNNLIKFLLNLFFLIQSYSSVYIFNISNVKLSNNIQENINFIIQNKIHQLLIHKFIQ